MRRLDVSKLLFQLSCLVGVFSYGVVVGHYHVFPYSSLQFVKSAVAEVFSQRQMLTGTRPSEHLQPSRYEGNGVTLLEEDGALPGLTLISGFFDDGLELRLIRLDGTIVARWPVHFHDLFPDTSHIQPASQIPRTNWNTSILGALALPDGSIVFNFEYGGLVKLDRCGTVEWMLPRMVHHSLELAEGGGYWVPGKNYITANSPFPVLSPPYIEETILRVSPTGKVIFEISIPHVLFENGLDALLFANGPNGTEIDRADLTQLNDVEELRSDLADKFQMFSAGDLLVSLRNLNMVFVVDPNSRKLKWHQTGPWLDQHDPDFTTRGTISVFSNNNDTTRTGSIFGGSSVIEIDPRTRETRVVYGQRPGQTFFTMYRRQHQLLRNGNVLISESMGGRAFEVTADRRLVWELVNRYDPTHIAYVNDVVTYPSEYFTVTDWSCPK